MRGKIKVIVLLGACGLLLTACIGEMTPTGAASQKSGTPKVTSKAPPTFGQVQIVVDRANVRAGASAKSKKIATITRGALLDKFAVKGNWIKVSLPDGRQGWIYKTLTRDIGPSR